MTWQDVMPLSRLKCPTTLPRPDARLPSFTLLLRIPNKKSDTTEHLEEILEVIMEPPVALREDSKVQAGEATLRQRKAHATFDGPTSEGFMAKTEQINDDNKDDKDEVTWGKTASGVGRLY